MTALVGLVALGMERSIKQTQIYKEKSSSMYETSAMQEGSMLSERELQEGP